MIIEEIIQQVIPDKEEYIVGYSNLTGLVPRDFEKTSLGITLGKKLDDRIIDSIDQGPTAEYYDLYNTTNSELTAVCDHITRRLQDTNYSAQAINPTMRGTAAVNPDFGKTLRCDFSHKMAATRAGLGWIGKTDLFISEKFGPRVRLATILTDYPLESSNSPINESQCGTCRACVDACPAQAATGTAWNTRIDRDEFYDAFKCLNKCVELSKARMNIAATVCGICISVCPRGKKKTPSRNTTLQNGAYQGSI